MRRSIRTRRVVAVAGMAVALVAGAAIVRSGGDTDPAEAGASQSPSPSPLGSDAPVPSPSTSTAPLELGASGDVELPVDPSGARGDQSEAGARQVAIDYLVTVRQRLVYLSEEAGHEVLTAWAAPGVAATVIDHDVAEAASIRQRLAEDGGQVWWVVSPLAIRVDAYSPERARVAVWLTAIIASGADPAVSSEATQPMVRFQIDSVELAWTEAAGWAVWSTTSVDGPTPMLAPSQPIANGDAFLSSLEGFELIRRHHG